jgi:predicted ATP-grasp superfamily ATP-dependent carboligase
MLAAALGDLLRVPGVEAFTLLDEGLRADPAVADAVGRWPSSAVRWVRPADEEQAFRTAAAESDWSLVIAPEFGRVLETRCRWVEGAGGRLLGSTPDAVALTADKLALGRYLDVVGVPTPLPQRGVDSGCAPLAGPLVVCKPRYGAGSQETFLTTFGGWLSMAMPAGPLGEMIVQPFVPGLAASVAFLIGPRQTVILCPAEQLLSDDGQFHYLGGRLPLPPKLAHRAADVARQAVGAVKGLAGYVGVDVVLGDAADGSRDYVIEINPRLTTSYVGLRAMTDENLMGLLLVLADGGRVAEPSWRAGGVQFTADGGVSPLRHGAREQE